MFIIKYIICLSCSSESQTWRWAAETWISCKQIDRKQYSLRNNRKRDKIWGEGHAMIIKHRDRAILHLTILIRKYVKSHLLSVYEILKAKTISFENMWSPDHYPKIKCHLSNHCPNLKWCWLHQWHLFLWSADILRKALRNKLKQIEKYKQKSTGIAAYYLFLQNVLS